MQGLRSEPESPQRFVSAGMESREFAAPEFQTWEHSIISHGANDVLRKFNRDTLWVAAGLLGTQLLVALAFVVLLPERHTMTAVLPKRASQAEPETSRNENAATRFRSTDLSANLSTSAVTPVNAAAR